jgi:hypothetical protein
MSKQRLRRRHRSPKEIVSVHLGCDTRTELELICEKEGRSLSGMLRVLAENRVRTEQQAALLELARRQNGVESIAPTTAAA